MALPILFLLCFIPYISTEEKVHNLANLRQLTFYETSEIPIALKWGPDDKTVIYQRHQQIYKVSTKEPFSRPHRLSIGLGSNQLVGLKSDGDLLYLTNAFRFKSLTDALQATLKDDVYKTEPYDLVIANSLGNLKHKANVTISKTAFADPTGKFIIYEDQSYIHLINTFNDSDRVIANRTGSDLRLVSGAFSRKLDRVVFSITYSGIFQVYSFGFNYETGNVLNGTILKESKTESFWVTDFTPCGKKVITTVCPENHRLCAIKVYSATDEKDSGVVVGSQDRGYTSVFGAAFSRDGKKLAIAKLSGTYTNVVIADWNCDDREHNTTPKRGQQKLDKQRISQKVNSRHSRYFDMVKRGINDSESKEKHLKNIRQVTFGGQNAEGYFAFKTDSFVFQAAGLKEYGTACDQIYRQDFDRTSESAVKSPPQRLSTGLGSCTCSYFFPDDTHAIYASTFLTIDPAKINDPTIGTCDPKKCQSAQAKTDPILKSLCNTSYTWDLHPGYDIFHVDGEGNFIERLTDTPGYDAEGAISPDGKLMVFTSVRSGDPELWLYNFETKSFKQLTNELGYDGGPFFSPDGTKIGFRASRPKTDADVKKYKQLLSYDLVEPLAMELYTINVDGSGIRRIAQLGNSNWAPFYLIDNRRIIFSSNYNATSFGGFDLNIINDDGTGLEQVTFSKGFDAFPMMSRDGRLLIWGSSRNGKSRTDLNLFVADWVD